MPAMPAKVHCICHLVRDIYSKLPEILDGEYRRISSGEVYPPFIAQIDKHWKRVHRVPLTDDDCQAATQLDDMKGHVHITHEAARAIEALLKKHAEIVGVPKSHEILSRALYRRYNEAGLEPPARLDVQFKTERDWFTARAHLVREEKKVPTEDGLKEHFIAFENALFALVGQYFDGTNELDAILNQANDTRSGEGQSIEALVAEAVPWLSSPHHEKYFFERLKNSGWIERLKRQGFFSNPPRVKRVAESVYCRHWPQSKYLARMAGVAPQSVVEILSTVDTDNWFVACDIIAAAKEMPPEHAAKLAPTIASMVEQLDLTIELEEVAEVAARLAKNQHADAAFSLTERAFSPSTLASISTPRRDNYSYFKGLNEIIIPSFIAVKTTALLRILMSWMRMAIESREVKLTDNNDHSYLWRPAIEDHAQNHDYDLASQMVTSVRDAFEQAIRGHHLSFAEVLAMLQNEAILIFARLRLHLITEFGEDNQELAKCTIMDRAIFDDDWRLHEYARLVNYHFPLLSDCQKQEWLGWVDKGPNTAEPGQSTDVSGDERRESRIEQWRFGRLHWIRNHLNGIDEKFGRQYEDFYRRMSKAHGPPHLADVHVWVGDGYWGSRSPFTVEQLTEMGFDAALEKVLQWKPEVSTYTNNPPCREGLIDVFARFLNTDAAAFSSKASLLKNAPADIVQRFLGVAESLVKEGKPFAIEEVLDLCNVFMNKAANVNGREQSAQQATSWCTLQIADLLQAICKARGPDKLPLYPSQHGDRIWEIIRKLSDQPDAPSTKDESGRDPRTADWCTRSLNSLAGKAMHAVFDYMHWKLDHVAPGWNSEPSNQRRPRHIAEVRDLLEQRLMREDDDFAARAVYGWRLTLLMNSDLDWLGSKIGRVFDLREFESRPEKASGWAAWNAFLINHRPHIEFWKLLHDQYAYAVNQAASVEVAPNAFEKPFDHLADHIMVYFGRGNLGQDAREAFEAHNGMVVKLVTKARETLRTHAIEFVGEWMANQGHQKVPPDAVRRFQALWEMYWESVGESDARKDPTSRTFGNWFASGVFDTQWSLLQLERFVSVAPKTNAHIEIVRRLVMVCEYEPLRSITVFAKLVEADDSNWHIRTWKDEAEHILTVALKAGGECRTLAKVAIDRLGRRDNLTFRELLSKS